MSGSLVEEPVCGDIEQQSVSAVQCSDGSIIKDTNSLMPGETMLIRVHTNGVVTTNVIADKMQSSNATVMENDGNEHCSNNLIRSRKHVRDKKNWKRNMIKRL